MPSPNYREGELEKQAVYRGKEVDSQAALGGHGTSFMNTSDLDHRRMKAAYYAMIEQVDTEVGANVASAGGDWSG